MSNFTERVRLNRQWIIRDRLYEDAEAFAWPKEWEWAGMKADGVFGEKLLVEGYV